MRNRLFAIAVAVVFLGGSQLSVGFAQQGQQQGRQGRQGGRPPLAPAEIDRLLNEEVIRQLRQRMEIPDSQVLARLTTLNRRFRDSLRVLDMRERFVRRELNVAARTDSAGIPRTVNQARVTCLLDAFHTVNQQRLDARRAEDRELAAFLTPSQRVRYMAVQENLQRTIDNFVERLNQRRGDGPGRRAGGPPPDSGGPPPVPPGGMRGGGGGRPGGPGRGPGRGPFGAPVC